jgi:hypothetical protein
MVNPMADYRSAIQRRCQAVLQPGERVLATVRAAAEVSTMGLLGGIPALLALSIDARREAEARGFPAATRMVLAATDRRLLVLPLKVRRPKVLRGAMPLEALKTVTVELRGLNPRLRFVMASGAEVTFTTYRLDHPDEFVRVLNTARERWTPPVPTIPSLPAAPVVPPPPPL